MTKDAPKSELIPTDAGEARITWHPAPAGTARLLLAVSHGAGGGIEARDLQALAAALPAHGVSVALVEQPWRVAGRSSHPRRRPSTRGGAASGPHWRRRGCR